MGSLLGSPLLLSGGAEYGNLPLLDYLEREFKRNEDSRKEIVEKLLKHYLSPSDCVIDFGCGPGFLAKAVSRHVSRVFACDISRGVIDCARILNSASNLEFCVLDAGKANPFEPGSIDLIYSFAVVQHVKEALFERALQAWFEALKPGGRLVFHVVIDAENWRSEADWSRDKSLQGRVRYAVGLHCFSRTEPECRVKVEGAGFKNVEIFPVNKIAEIRDDIGMQHLVTALK